MLEPVQPVSLRHAYRPPAFNLIVVGAGGTGGYVVQYLTRLLYAWSTTPAFKAQLVVVDGDTVEDANLLRQHFLPRDVGRPKATVLAERFGAIYGVPVLSIPHYLTEDTALDAVLTSPVQDPADPPPPWMGMPDPLDILVGCVDNHATRQILDRIFHRFLHLVYIDAGNDGVYLPMDPRDPAEAAIAQSSGYGGHVVTGVKLKGQVVLPPVGTVFPDILTDTASALPGQACGQQAASQPQRMLTNVWAAMTVLSALNSILADQQVGWHVANFNAQHATIRSAGLTPSFWEPAAPVAPEA